MNNMLEHYDPRPHKWLALDYRTTTLICFAKSLDECIKKAKKIMGDSSFITAYGVVGDYRKR